MTKCKHSGTWPLEDIFEAACKVADAGIHAAKAQIKRSRASGRMTFRWKAAPLPLARGLYAAIGNEMGYSYPYLAAYLNCDHSTLVHAAKRVRQHLYWFHLRRNVLDELTVARLAQAEMFAAGGDHDST